MAAWHQQRRPVRLWDEHQWNLITDPPNDLSSIMSFSTEQAALNCLAGRATHGHDTRHSYILPPGNADTRSRTRVAVGDGGMSGV
jgi:hypothetical protein